MLRSLPTFMDGVAGKSARDDAKLGAELAGHIVSLEASLGLDWRAQQSLLLAMPALSQVPHPTKRLLTFPIVGDASVQPKVWQQTYQEVAAKVLSFLHPRLGWYFCQNSGCTDMPASNPHVIFCTYTNAPWAPPQVLNSDACYDVLLPMALRQFSAGPSVLRAPAADAIVALMRAVQKPYQRTEILCRLLREYAQGRSCYRRLAFLDAAAAMLCRYSVRYSVSVLPRWKVALTMIRA